MYQGAFQGVAKVCKSHVLDYVMYRKPILSFGLRNGIFTLTAGRQQVNILYGVG